MDEQPERSERDYVERDADPFPAGEYPDRDLAAMEVPIPIHVEHAGGPVRLGQAAVSGDGEHLVGYAWSVDPEALMPNCGNPRPHTGTSFSPRLEPGESHTWHGRIYLMANDPSELLRRVDADRAAWRRSATT